MGWIIYKLFSSLKVDTCKDIIDETLLQNLKDRLFGLGYVGSVNNQYGDFWVYNRVSIFRGRFGRYEFSSVRKFQGNILKDKNETIIIGEFKLLGIYKIWWSAWFLILSLILVFCLYDFMLLSNSFTSIMPILILVLGMYIVGGWIVRYNILKGKKAEEDTIDFIKKLLEVYEVEYVE